MANVFAEKSSLKLSARSRSFEFTPASRFGIRCERDVPESVFMVLVFDHQKMVACLG